MKEKKFLIIIGSIVFAIAVGLVGLSFKLKSRNQIKLSAVEVHQMITGKEHYFDPNQLSEIIDQSDSDVLLIDIRTPDQFINYHIVGAINIPYQRILDKEYEEILDDDRTKILYSADEVKSAEVWTILRQLGYENIFVLQGGLNFWMSKIEKKDIFGPVTLDDEKARFDFKKEINPQ